MTERKQQTGSGETELDEEDLDEIQAGGTHTPGNQGSLADNLSGRDSRGAATGSPNVTVNGGPIAFVSPLVDRK